MKENKMDVDITKKKIFRVMVFFSIHAGLCGSVDSYAQTATYESVPQPVVTAMDANGIDLARGSAHRRTPTLAIGDPKSGGMTYDEEMLGTYSGQDTSNLDYRLIVGSTAAVNQSMLPPPFNTEFKNIKIISVTSPYNSSKFISLNSSSITNITEFQPRRGAKLETPGSGEVNPYGEMQFTYTAPNGDVIIFFCKDGLWKGTYSNFIPYKIIKPNGEVITYVYSVFTNNSADPINRMTVHNYSLEYIKNNYGYELKYLGTSPGQSIKIGSDTVSGNEIYVLFNSAYEYCSDTAISCNFVNSWPYLTHDGLQTTDTSSGFTSWTTSGGQTYRVNIAAGWTSDTLIYPDGTSETFNYDPSMFMPDGDSGCYAVSAFDQGVAVGPVCPGNYVTSYSNQYGTWHYARSFPLRASGSYKYIDMATTVTNPNGESISVENLPEGQLLYKKDGLGRITNYQSTPLGGIGGETLTGITFPSGRTNSYQYDANGNVIKFTDTPASPDSSAPLVTGATYPTNCDPSSNICDKPISVTAPGGGTTNYTYNGQGGILTRMGPAPTPGAPRPLVVTTWTQHDGVTLNASGALVPNNAPIWQINSETECQTVAGSNNPVCDATASQRVTTYQYGAAGTPLALQVKGVLVNSGGLTLATCYTYDKFGRKSSETSPNAGVSTCP